MQGEREKNRSSLVQRYGLSRRAATRVVALLEKPVDFTPTLLEMAGEREGMEELVTCRGLMKRPDEISEAELRGLAEECGCEDADLLRLVRDEETGWTTIALEDDLIAEQAEREEEMTEEGAAAGGIVKAEPTGMSRAETEELFSSEAVSELKLNALTSQDPDQRTEALRKLVFSPLDGRRKASIFVNVMVDPEARPKVRREAVRSLEQIGFRSALADALRGMLGSEEEEDTTYYIRRLGSLVEDAEQAEKTVVTAVVLESLGNTDDSNLATELLQLTTRLAPVLMETREKAEEFLRSSLKQLQRDFDRLRNQTELTLAACYNEDADLLMGLLWDELDRADSPRIRAFLLRLAVNLTGGRRHARKLAKEALKEMVESELPEGQTARLRHALADLGEPAAELGLEHLRKGERGSRSELVRILNTICYRGEVAAHTVNKVTQAFVDHLQVADRTTRRTILDAEACADPRVQESIQRKLASEYLSHLDEFQLPDTQSSIRDTLEKIGVPAVEPMFDYIRKHYPRRESPQVCDSLGHIIREHAGRIPSRLAERMAEHCRGLLKDTELEEGNFTMVLAAVVGYTGAGEEMFEPVLEDMKDNLWRAQYSFDMLYALGQMAGSPNAAPEQQRTLFQMFHRIVQMEGPEQLGTRKQTERGTVYEFGKAINFDTKVIPAALQGLKAICVSDQAPDELRGEIVKDLLVLWEGVTRMQIVWSPGAVDALIDGICGAACCDHVDARLRIKLGRSLLRFLNKVKVVKSMGLICGQSGAPRQMQALALETGSKLIEAWEDCDRQDYERRVALVRSIGRIASNEGLNADDQRVQDFRERALSTLFSALRDGMRAAYDPLDWLRDCSAIPEERREEIDQRLGKAFGLQRA